MQTWSVIRGVTNGVFSEKTEPIDEKNSLAAAIGTFLQVNEPSVLVMYDVLDHLDAAVMVRAIRELIQHCRTQHSTLICIDHRHDWPAAIAGETQTVDIPLPDSKELMAMARQELRALKEQRQVSVTISKIASTYSSTACAA